MENLNLIEKIPQRPSICLASGNHFYFDEPEKNIILVSDLARNLSREPRYNGSTEGEFGYSVAQHAVNASYIVDPVFAFEALHHDDAEAFYKDITTWLKRRIPCYKDELKRGEDALNTHWGLPLEMSPEVKLADLQMLKMEKMTLFPNYNEKSEGFVHIADIDVTGLRERVDLKPWHPKLAEQMYLERHEELINAAL